MLPQGNASDGKGNEVMADSGVMDMISSKGYDSRPIHHSRHEHESESVRPLSDDPKDTGLYIVTRSFERFFRRELEKNKNGNRHK